MQFQSGLSAIRGTRDRCETGIPFLLGIFLNSLISLCCCTSDSLSFIAVRMSLAALAPQLSRLARSCPYSSPLSWYAHHLPSARLDERLDERLQSYVDSP